jgi:hypothetical protein
LSLRGEISSRFAARFLEVDFLALVVFFAMDVPPPGLPATLSPEVAQQGELSPRLARYNELCGPGSAKFQ